MILLLVRPLAGYLPVASMAAMLFIVAWGLIDIAAMRRVWRTSRADALTLAVTFIATLTIRLEVAILVGVLVSLLIYLNWATHPQLLRVVPDAAAQRRFRSARADALLCPQLDILRIDGSLFFGSVEHIRDEIEAARASRPATRHLLLIGSGLNLIDNAGAELIGHLARRCASPASRSIYAGCDRRCTRCSTAPACSMPSGATACSRRRIKRSRRSTRSSMPRNARRARLASSPNAR